MLIEGMSPFDAFYMTVITFSTVGFGEVTPLSRGGRMFTVVLIVFSAGVVAYALSQSADLILGRQAALLARRKRRMIEKLTKHTLICGFGRVGRIVADGLKEEGQPFVVVDLSEARIRSAQTKGYLTVQGNAADEHILQEAGIARARGLVACVDTDAENVFVTLTARSLNPNLTIVARANYEESEAKLRRAGANQVVLPAQIGGRRVVTTLLRPHVAAFLDEVVHSAGVELLMEQLTLPAESALVGQTLAEAQLRTQTGVTVLACFQSGERVTSAPQANTPLQPGTNLVLLGTREQLWAFEQLAGIRR